MNKARTCFFRASVFDEYREVSRAEAARILKKMFRPVCAIGAIRKTYSAPAGFGFGDLASLRVPHRGRPC